MKPYLHALSSANKFGGKPEDYLPIHDLMDLSKSSEATVKHRCIFHSSFGCYIVEKIFGVNISNSDNKLVSTRDIAEQHCMEDLGCIPSLSEWLKDMPIADWMGGIEKAKRVVDMDLKEKLIDALKAPAPITTPLSPIPDPFTNPFPDRVKVYD